MFRPRRPARDGRRWNGRVVAGLVATLLAQMSPARAESLLERYGAVAGTLAVPAIVATATSSPRRVPCSAHAMPELLASIQAGDYAGRAGSLALAAQITSCDDSVMPQLLAAYAVTQPDGPSLAAVGRAARVIAPAEYDQLVGDWLSELAAAGGNRVLNPLTAIAFMQWAAGDCAQTLTATCLRAVVSRLLSSAWSLDQQANLAFGDLFAVQPPGGSDAALADALRPLLADGLPIRADVVVATTGTNQAALQNLRIAFLQRMFGSGEEL